MDGERSHSLATRRVTARSYRLPSAGRVRGCGPRVGFGDGASGVRAWRRRCSPGAQPSATGGRLPRDGGLPYSYGWLSRPA